MKALWLALLGLLITAPVMAQTSQEVGSYPNATSPLTGTERILADQGAFNTVNITPAQLQNYVFGGGSNVVLPVTLGGTGLASVPTNGQLLIGNGTGFSLGVLTAGANITITNSAGVITISSTGGSTPGGMPGSIQVNNAGVLDGVLPGETGLHMLNWSSLSTAPTLSAFNAALVVAQFTGCTGTLLLGADGACHAGGASSFDQITSGTNTTGAFVMGSGSTLTPSGTGVIAASQAATTPTQCPATEVPTGVDISFNATGCFTPTGSGNVSNSGTPTAGQFTTWVDTTHIQGTSAGSNTLLGNSGSGVAALTPAQAIAVLNSQTCNAQTGTTYTLVAGDVNSCVTMSNAAANTLTVPPNSSVAFAIGSVITVEAIGTGVTTVQPGTGVTIQGSRYGASTSQPYSLGGAYGLIQLHKVATDTWNVDLWDVPAGLPTGGSVAVSGTCTTSAHTASAKAGTVTMGGAGSCTIILTLAGVTPAAHGWAGTMWDQTQPTVPTWGNTSSGASSITYTVPAAVASSDVLSFAIGNDF